jgi:hypothetical protein
VDPLTERIDLALDEFTTGVNVKISSADCSRRLEIDEMVQNTMSLVESIQEGISYANDELNSTGILLEAEVVPYFNSSTFSIGVNVDLKAEIQVSAADVIEIVSDFIHIATNPSEESSDSRLGLGDDPLPGIDLYGLASNAVLKAGLDISFGVDINMIQSLTSLLDGFSLYIDTYGAFAEIVVDPIDISFSLFEKDIVIRDSHFATTAELRSAGRFSVSINDVLSGNIDLAPLLPTLTVPISTELIIQIPVTEEITVTPIMSAEGDNLLNGDFSFYFDVDLDTFLNSEYMGVNTLTSVLQYVSDLLQQVASIQLLLHASETPSVLDGLFTVINQLDDLADRMLTYIDLTTQGACKPFLITSHG